MSNHRYLLADTENVFLAHVHNRAVAKVLSGYADYCGNSKSLSNGEEKLQSFFNLLQQRFFTGLDTSLRLAKKSFAGGCYDPKRISYFNSAMVSYKKSLLKLFPPAAGIWVLDGLIFQNQIAGIRDILPMEQ